MCRKKKNAHVRKNRNSVKTKVKEQGRTIAKLNEKINQMRKASKGIKTTKKTPPHWLYSSDAWKELRYKTLRRFGFKCLACNATDTELHVDHIVPVSVDRSRALDEDNLQVLCRDCNLSKSNKFQDDLRPVVFNKISYNNKNND